MGNNGNKQRLVISLGGSLIVPNGGIDTSFLQHFNNFIRKILAQDKNRQFFLVAGGGVTARHYRDGGRNVVGHELTADDLDWLGIHASRLNAHLIRTIFRDIAHPYIVKHYEIIRKVSEPIVVGGGWKPGWSTDYCAVLLCEDYNVDTILNLSDIPQVYDKDPQYPDAKPQRQMNWGEFRKLVGDTWIPGMNVPFDPIASKKAQELRIKLVVMRGNDFDNLANYFARKEFVGTTIE